MELSPELFQALQEYILAVSDSDQAPEPLANITDAVVNDKPLKPATVGTARLGILRLWMQHHSIYQAPGSTSAGSLGQGAGDGVGHEAAAQGEDCPAPHSRACVEHPIGHETGHDGHQVRWRSSGAVGRVR